MSDIKTASYNHLADYYGRIVSTRFAVFGFYITALVALMTLLAQQEATPESAQAQPVAVISLTQHSEKKGGDNVFAPHVSPAQTGHESHSQSAKSYPWLPWVAILVANSLFRLFEARNIRILSQVAYEGVELEKHSEGVEHSLFKIHPFIDMKDPTALSSTEALCQTFLPLYRVFKASKGEFLDCIASHSFALTATIGAVNFVAVWKLCEIFKGFLYMFNPFWKSAGITIVFAFVSFLMAKRIKTGSHNTEHENDSKTLINEAISIIFFVAFVVFALVANKTETQDAEEEQET
ncbi:MAG: hypothetical protein KF784_00085 [Fimbriimonadaceae bacterium]|nr:hypothetical protein [Fimbriimonadaceae bacterium]